MKSHFLTQWLKNIPILVIGSVITFVLGSTVWFVLDKTQSTEVKTLLANNLERALDSELSEARIRLNNYIDDYIKFSYTLAQQIQTNSLSIRNIIASNPMLRHPSTNTQPDWGIENEFWDFHPAINYVLTFDEKRQLYESLNRQETQNMLNIDDLDPYLIDISLDTSFMLLMDHKPVIISSREYNIAGHLHYLMLIKVIDNQFLIDSQKRALFQGKIVAIFDNESDKVIASTSPKALSANATVKQLTQNYKIAGKQYFDYGNSELETQFALLIPKNLYANLNLELLVLDRKNRVIIIVLMSSMTFLGLLLLVRSIINLANTVSRHSSQTFHAVKTHQVVGNEFTYLKNIFDRFALRALSDKQIDEQKAASNARSLQLSVLSGITKELNVGVIMEKINSYTVYNSVMEQYLKDATDLSLFTDDFDKPEINLIDIHHNRRVFKRSIIQIDGDSKAIIIQDITKASLHSEALEEMALHDSLTGLPNRVLLHDRIQSGIKLSKREHKSCLLLMMDLNRFKHVNDTLGHSTGDELLKQVASRMSEQIRETDTLSRIGGDEFAILLINSDIEWSKKIAINLKQAISKPFHIMNNTIEIGVSIGITSIENVHNAEELMSQADIAMYHTKRENLEYCFYSQDIDPGHSDRTLIINSLRSGLDNNEFQLYYQPQVSPNNKNDMGFEALVRWQHPTLGFLPPDVFISLAEENGYINELTQSIFSMAIKQSEQWLEQGLKINLSINLSAANLHDISLLPFISRILEESTIAAEQLTLEITESMLMQDQSDIIDKLNQIKFLGMRLSIDDFGTGYSSLAYLRHMPVDELKIDRSFISDLNTFDSDLKLVHSIIDLAHNLDLEVVAEGIETEVQQQLLTDLKCERLQGYLYSKPMPSNQVVKWVSDFQKTLP